MYTREQEQRLDELHEQWSSYDSRCDETDALEAEIDAITQAAAISAWTGEMKAGAGLMVSGYQRDVSQLQWYRVYLREWEWEWEWECG